MVYFRQRVRSRFQWNPVDHEPALAKEAAIKAPLKERGLNGKSISFLSFLSGLIIFTILTGFLFIREAGAAAGTTCNFTNVTDVDFGNYDTLSGLNNDSTGSISIFCDKTDMNVRISIGPSSNSGGFTPRQMRLTTGTDLLNYNLYTTAARTTIWEDGTQGTSIVNIGVKKGTTTTQTIYGRIPPGVNVGIGEYGEVLLITIEY